jgi:tripartite-type tricarboxylate transporter receptor subunit TctC
MSSKSKKANSGSRKALTIIFTAVLSFSTSAALAQDFPNKPIRLVVAQGAGSVQDVAARLLVSGMSRALGQPVVVEAMPGATGLVAFEFIAKAAPDGYTLLYTSNNIALMPVFLKDLRLDPVRDLPPISTVAELISIVASSAQAPWQSFSDMIAYIKANPGKVNYASTGLQGVTTMHLEVLKAKFGLQVANIPYRGGSPDVLRALATNESQFSTGLLENHAVSERGATNRFRTLAVVRSKRLASLPDVPSTVELGIPELSVNTHSIHSPAGLRRPVLDKLYSALSYGLQQAEVKEGYSKLYLHIVGSSPDESAKRFSEEVSYNLDVAKKAGIKPE